MNVLNCKFFFANKVFSHEKTKGQYLSQVRVKYVGPFVLIQEDLGKTSIYVDLDMTHLNDCPPESTC